LRELRGAVDDPDWVIEVGKVYDVILESVLPDGLIKTIIAVQHQTGLDLLEAKQLVEGAPVTIQEGLLRQEAESLQKLLESSSDGTIQSTALGTKCCSVAIRASRQ